MKIKLNGEDWDFQLENENTMGDVLGIIEESCQKEKMTVVEVKVDDKVLSLSDLDNFFNQSVDNEFNIELSTMNGNDVKNMLKKIGQNFINLAEDLETVPVKMQSGEDESVIKIIENFSLNLQDLYSLAKFFELADIESNYKFGDKTLNEHQEQISENLKILVEAFENNDSIEISDISEYELSPLAKTLGNGLLSIS